MLESLSFVNGQAGWELAETKFNPGLTLLVGGSGAGKTSILRAISSLKRATARYHSDGIPHSSKWNAKMRNAEGVCFDWHAQTSLGEISESNEPDDDDVPDSFQATVFGVESLQADGELIARRGRDGNVDFFPRGRDPVTGLGLDNSVSVVRSLGREPRLGQMIELISKIFTTEGQENPSHLLLIDPDFRRHCQAPLGTLELRAMPTNLETKIVVANECCPELLRRVEASFCEVFPAAGVPSYSAEADESGLVTLNIRLRFPGESRCLEKAEISSGMWKTLMHIWRVELHPDDSLMLIDEFENSLGVNCLDAVTEHLMEASKRLQFIVTSHHPYVINNIPYENWRVVRRDGPRIYTQTAAEAGIDAKNRHSRFHQLMNSEAFQNPADAA